MKTHQHSQHAVTTLPASGVHDPVKEEPREAQGGDRAGMAICIRHWRVRDPGEKEGEAAGRSLVGCATAFTSRKLRGKRVGNTSRIVGIEARRVPYEQVKHVHHPRREFDGVDWSGP